MFSWMKSRFQWENEIKSSEICLGTKPADILFPWAVTMAEAKHMCEKYQGKSSVINSVEMRDTLFSLMDNIPELKGCAWPKCVAWTGYSDEEIEGIFVDIHNQQVLNFSPWAQGEPNGKQNENCGISNKPSPNWYDAPCENSYLSFCRMEGISRFHLRGNMLKQVNKQFTSSLLNFQVVLIRNLTI